MLPTHFWMACLTAAVVTGLLITILRPIAGKLGLVDVPNARKHHVGSVPLIGGLAMYGGIAAGLVFYGDMGPFRASVIETAGVMAVIGALDDRHDLSVRIRLVAQMLCVLTVCISTGVHITSLGHIFGEPIELGMLGIPVTIFAVIGLLNAFNLMDGIDGLAGTQALVSVATLMIFHGQHDLRGTIILMSLLASAALPYLAVNLGLTRRRIFMGDAGSMVIGYMLAWALIRLSEASDSSVSPSDVLWCVAVPVLDTVTVMSRRIMERSSPFKADRGHIHHLLLGRGLSPRQALLVLLVFSALLSCIGYGIRSFSSGTSIVCFIAVAAVYATVTVREYHRQASPERRAAVAAVAAAAIEPTVSRPLVPAESALVD